MAAVDAGVGVGGPADPEGLGAVPVGARGRIARTSTCTAAGSASTMAGSPRSPPPLLLLVVGAVVVVVVTADVVASPGSAILQKI